MSTIRYIASRRTDRTLRCRFRRRSAVTSGGREPERDVLAEAQVFGVEDLAHPAATAVRPSDSFRR